jgi:hypothetical protein
MEHISLFPPTQAGSLREHRLAAFSPFGINVPRGVDTPVDAPKDFREKYDSEVQKLESLDAGIRAVMRAQLDAAKLDFESAETSRKASLDLIGGYVETGALDDARAEIRDHIGTVQGKVVALDAAPRLLNNELRAVLIDHLQKFLQQPDVQRLIKEDELKRDAEKLDTDDEKALNDLRNRAQTEMAVLQQHKAAADAASFTRDFAVFFEGAYNGLYALQNDRFTSVEARAVLTKHIQDLTDLRAQYPVANIDAQILAAVNPMAAIPALAAFSDMNDFINKANTGAVSVVQQEITRIETLREDLRPAAYTALLTTANGFELNILDKVAAVDQGLPNAAQVMRTGMDGIRAIRALLEGNAATQEMLKAPPKRVEGADASRKSLETQHAERVKKLDELAKAVTEAKTGADRDAAQKKLEEDVTQGIEDLLARAQKLSAEYADPVKRGSVPYNVETQINMLVAQAKSIQEKYLTKRSVVEAKPDQKKDEEKKPEAKVDLPANIEKLVTGVSEAAKKSPDLSSEDAKKAVESLNAEYKKADDATKATIEARVKQVLGSNYLVTAGKDALTIEQSRNPAEQAKEKTPETTWEAILQVLREWFKKWQEGKNNQNNVDLERLQKMQELLKQYEAQGLDPSRNPVAPGPQATQAQQQSYQMQQDAHSKQQAYEAGYLAAQRQTAAMQTRIENYKDPKTGQHPYYGKVSMRLLADCTIRVEDKTGSGTLCPKIAELPGVHAHLPQRERGNVVLIQNIDLSSRNVNSFNKVTGSNAVIGDGNVVAQNSAGTGAAARRGGAPDVAPPAPAQRPAPSSTPSRNPTAAPKPAPAPAPKPPAAPSRDPTNPATPSRDPSPRRPGGSRTGSGGPAER